MIRRHSFAFKTVSLLRGERTENPESIGVAPWYPRYCAPMRMRGKIEAAARLDMSANGQCRLLN
jgi:hypothetical protein